MKIPDCGLCNGTGKIEAFGDGEPDQECTVCEGQGLAAIPDEDERAVLAGFHVAMLHCDMETNPESGLCECFERLLIILRRAAS